MLADLKRDAARYSRWYTDAGFWIVANYRFGMWAHGLPALLRLPFWILYRLLRLPFVFYKVHLWAGARGARVGPGFYLIHPSNVQIGRGVEIGENCIIFHDVTLGRGPLPGSPRIGANVDIYVGARILGGVRVGDNAMIGANCVITRNVPADTIAMVPATRLIPRALSPVARGADRKKAAEGAD